MASGVDFEGRNRIFPIAPGVRAYLEELDVEYVVAAANHDRFMRVASYTPVFQDGIYHVYRVDGRESRAYAVGTGCLRRRDLLACRTGPSVRTTVTGSATRRLEIEPAPSAPLLLITGEPWYPGWRAQSSTGSLPVSRIGYLAAVSVPRGTTQVQLSYRAPGLLVGGVLSMLAIGSSLFFLAYQRRRWTSSRNQ